MLADQISSYGSLSGRSCGPPRTAGLTFNRSIHRAGNDLEFAGGMRLTYLVMSAFVAWHTLAMVIAPAPDSSVCGADVACRSPTLPDLVQVGQSMEFLRADHRRVCNFATPSRMPPGRAMPLSRRSS